MKNTILLLAFVLCMGATQAQITLDGTMPSVNGNSNYLSVVRFGYAGDKYLMNDLASHQVQIYNLNQVLEKTITIPTSIIGAYYVSYFFSDNLFNMDSSIEYVILVSQALLNSHFYIFNEDSNIIFSHDSVAYFNTGNYYGTSGFGPITPTTSGTKLILKKVGDGYDIYSLPGSLPCYECSNGVYTGNFSPAGGDEQRISSLSNPYPNPTSNQTRIDYTLPAGITQGEIVFYNSMGVEMKRFKVTGVFSFIYVSAHDLPSGTYYYNLQTSAGESDGKKMVVIR